MIWGFPAAFYFSALALPVVAVFLYKRRSRIVQVPAVQMWLAVGRPAQVHSVRSLLRRLFSLLMQLLVILLLILALADPSPQRPATGRTVLVVDVSATMQTQEPGGQKRIELAKREAQRLLGTLGAEGEVVIVESAHVPRLCLAPSKDRKLAGQRISAIEALDVDGDLQRAIQAAGSFVDPEALCQVLVISDFAGQDLGALRQLWRSPARLRFVPIGSDQPNVAITNLWAEPEPQARRITVSLAQRGLGQRPATVHLLLNGQRIATQDVSMDQSPAQATFVQDMAPGATFEVALDRPDALMADNRVRGIVGQRQQLQVCLVSAGNAPLERALSADPSVALRRVSPGAFRGPVNDTVVVIDGPGVTNCSPGDARGYLFIGAPDPFGLCQLAPPASAPAITHWVGDHASMLDIDPTLFRARRLMAPTFAANLRPVEIVGADQHPVIVGLTHSTSAGVREQRYLYWLFDLGDSDLVRRVTFPLLLWNAIDYLAHGDQGSPQEAYLTGQPLRLKSATAGEKPMVLDPAGQALGVKFTGADWLVTDTLKQGIYKRQDSGEGFALNFLSSRTTLALGRQTDGAVQGQPADAQAAGWLSLRGRVSWSTLLRAAGVLCLVEWLLFNRGIVRIG